MQREELDPSNLFFLFTISLISFGTALFGAYASNPLAVTVYTVILVAVGFSLYRLWHYADGHGLLVAGTTPARQGPARSWPCAP